MTSINILTDIVPPLLLPRQAQVRSILNTVRDYKFSSRWLELRVTMHADNCCGQATTPTIRSFIGLGCVQNAYIKLRSMLWPRGLSISSSLFYACARAFIMADLKKLYVPVVVDEPSPSSTASPKLLPQTNSPFGTFNPRSSEKRLRDVHWVSPTKMVTLLVFGISMSLAHHLYYQSRVGKVVGNESDQQNKHRLVSNFDSFFLGELYWSSHLLTD
jgi:hypothetical protein